MTDAEMHELVMQRAATAASFGVLLEPAKIRQELLFELEESRRKQEQESMKANVQIPSLNQCIIRLPTFPDVTCRLDRSLLQFSGVQYEMDWKILCAAPSMKSLLLEEPTTEGRNDKEFYLQKLEERAEKIATAIHRCFHRCGEIFHPGYTSGSPGRRSVKSEMNTLFDARKHADNSTKESSGKQKEVKVSESLRKVLCSAQLLHRHSNGIFDPMHAGEAQVWKWSLRHEKQVPSAGSTAVQEALAEAESVSGWDKLRFDEESGTISPEVFFPDYPTAVSADFEELSGPFAMMVAATAGAPTPPRSLCPLDLSSLAKGWCVDEIFTTLLPLIESLDQGSSSSSQHSLLVDWGGDIRTIGKQPNTQKPWIVGIVQPSKLKPLFDAWFAAEEKRSGGGPRNFLSLTEKSYLHAVPMPEEGAAIATSGDYQQLQKWGFTHLWDVQKKHPMKVQNHTLASATVMAPTCLEADGLATAILLQGTMLRALDFIIELRQKQKDNEILQRRSGGDAKNETMMWNVQQYYLYERNHQTFVHDATDNIVGEGDQVRRFQADKESQKAAVFHALSEGLPQHHQTKPRRKMNDGNNDDVDSEHFTADGTQLVVNSLKDIARLQPSGIAIGIVSPATEVLLPLSPTVDTDDNRYPSRKALIGKSQRLPFHATVLSSLVFTHPPSFDKSQQKYEPGVISFNIMRGSAICNHVRAPGMVLCLHLLPAFAVHQYELLRNNHASWLASVEPCWFESVGRSPVERVVGVSELEIGACLGVITFVVECGDHLVVQAQLYPMKICAPRDPTAPATDGAATNTVQALYQFRNLPISIPQPLSPPDSFEISDANQCFPQCCLGSMQLAMQWWQLTTPAVFLTDHPEYGRMGFPVRGFRLCSLSPPVVSVFAVTTDIVSDFVSTRIPPTESKGPRANKGPSCELIFLSSTSSDGKLFDPFTKKGKTARGNTDHSPEREISDIFSFIPFSVFQSKPEGTVASITGSAIAAFSSSPAPLKGSAGDALTMTTFLVDVEKVVRCRSGHDSTDVENRNVPFLLYNGNRRVDQVNYLT